MLKRRLHDARMLLFIALFFLAPIGGCFALSSRGLDQVGVPITHDDSGDGIIYGNGCGLASETCEWTP